MNGQTERNLDLVPAETLITSLKSIAPFFLKKPLVK